LVSLDRNQFNDGILPKYKLFGKPGNMFDWKQLYNRSIQSSDPKHLVETIGFLIDRCSYKITDRHYRRNNREFHCQNCKTFKLKFSKRENDLNNNQDYFDLELFSTLQHNNNCNLSPSKPHRFISKYLAESPLLIDLVKRQLIENPNKNGQIHDLIISGLCLNEDAVSNQSINRVLTSLKKI
jgi:hypothetical protein